MVTPDAAGRPAGPGPRAGREVSIEFPAGADEDLLAQIHTVVSAVVARGGAVGWLSPPSRAETDAWVTSVVDGAATGESALCVARVDGVVAATGTWHRDQAPVFRHRAEIRKIMAHPSSRGLGLGRRVTGAVADHARAAGIETVHLGVRGNNHLAIAVYRGLGFTEWGRFPNVIEVGDLRFDEVRMYLRFPTGVEVVNRGSQQVGPGSSPAPAG